MSFGRMRDIIEVLEKRTGTDGIHTVDEYIAIAEVRGYIKPTTGRKFFEAAAVHAEKVVTVIIRYNPYIKETCRLRFNGLDYQIKSVADIENRNMYMEIKCEAVISG